MKILITAKSGIVTILFAAFLAVGAVETNTSQLLLPLGVAGSQGNTHHAAHSNSLHGPTWPFGTQSFPLALHVEARRALELLRKESTFATNLALYTIDIKRLAELNATIHSSVPLTNICNWYVEFQFVTAQRGAVRPRPVAMGLDGSLMGTIGAVASSPSERQSLVLRDRSSPSSHAGDGVYSTNGVYSPDFLLPSVQWSALREPLPVDLVQFVRKAERVAAAKTQEFQNAQLDWISLQSYMPIPSVLARGQPIDAHRNHWLLACRFYVVKEGIRSWHWVHVLLDGRTF